MTADGNKPPKRDEPKSTPKSIMKRPTEPEGSNNGGKSLNDSIHAHNNWADESEYLHPSPKGYPRPINDLKNPEETNKLDQIMLKLDTVANQLIQFHDDLKYTKDRVASLETLLNVYSIFPQQAMILNSRPTGEHMDEDDYIVQAGIDTSESVVISHKIDINTLKEENAYL